MVRIEDLDRARVAAAGKIASTQLRDLESLGLDWDGPVVRQSERLDLYADAVAGLETYPCFCTRRKSLRPLPPPTRPIGARIRVPAAASPSSRDTNV